MDSVREWRVIALYVVAGVFLAIAVFHPAIELVHWQRTGPPSGSWVDGLVVPLQTAFSARMLSMALLLGFAGALVGGGLGALQLRVARVNRHSVTHQMGTADVLALIAQGEGELLEFKSSLRWDRRQGKVNRQLEAVIAASIAGLMNHEGGSLLIGVADNGEITGIEEDYTTLNHANWDGFERTLMNLLASRLGAQHGALVHCHQFHIDAKSICLVAVEKAPGPVYCRDGNVERYFVRTGNTTRELDAHEAVDHISQRNGT